MEEQRSEDNMPEESMMQSESAGQMASRSKRLTGAIFDSIISMAVIIPIMMVTGAFQSPPSVGYLIFMGLFGLVVFLCIHGYLLAKHGQTVGKKIVGTRIVSIENEHILPLGKVFGLRYLPIAVIAQIPFAGGLFCMADTLFIFRNDKRCIHDLIAGTKVVDA